MELPCGGVGGLRVALWSGNSGHLAPAAKPVVPNSGWLASSLVGRLAFALGDCYEAIGPTSFGSLGHSGHLARCGATLVFPLKIGVLNC